MGYSKTTLVATKYKLNGEGDVTYEVLQLVNDKDLGGRNLDERMLQLVQRKYEGECDFSNPRMRDKALKQIESTRKALSGDTEATLSIEECIDGDEEK